MRSRISIAISLLGVTLGLLLMSACDAPPAPAVQIPAAQTKPVVQIPTAQATLVVQVPTLQTNGQTATVQRGTIRTAVNASGKLEPVREVKLNFGVPGTVKEILVNEGQPVKAGEVLARLGTDELELAVERAQQALENEQLAYSLVITPTRADVAAARAALASATANLTDLQSGPDPRQVEIARLQLEQARQARLPQPLAIQIAELQYALAQSGSTAAQIAAANAQVAQAQAQLDKLLVSDDRTQALAALPLKSAELNLQEAQQHLGDAQLVSPIDGVLSNLNISVGDRVDANSVATVSDLSAFNVEFVVDETNVGLLAEKQPAVVGLAALPSQTLTGQVDRIASTLADVAGAAGYKVVVGLAKTDAPVRGGMSANVAVIVGVSDNVLVVPNWAIRTVRSTGKTSVYVKRGDKVEETEIVIGLYDENQSEVKSGLNEGDILVAPPKSGP